MTPFPFGRHFLGDAPLVLASGSPRRAELLRRVGAPFKVVLPPSESPPGDGPPEGVVCALAREKAEGVASLHPDSWVLGADTLVLKDGMLLGKPADPLEASRMLRSLSGAWHEVYTGICLVRKGRSYLAWECSRVRFVELTDRDIKDYIETREPMDKAGAYGIQGYGALWVAGIEGCYFNVMGLPLSRLGRLFREASEAPGA